MKLMKLVFVLGVWLPLFSMGQGIAFSPVAGWKALLAKARAEDKYIFVDCFTTWCGPCRLMDKQVYVDSGIGRALNDGFISVKVQFDRTGSDGTFEKSWYADSKMINDSFRIQGYPTCLFFNSEGKLIYRALGYHDKNEFRQIIDRARHAEKEYLPLVERVRTGTLPLDEYPKAVGLMSSYGNKELADKMARKYIVERINKLPMDSVLSPATLRQCLQWAFYFRSGDPVFKLSLREPSRIDSVFKGQGTKIALTVITIEEVINKYPKSDRPDVVDPAWNTMLAAIRRKYGAYYPEQNLQYEKEAYYRGRKEWNKFADCVDARLRVYQPKEADFWEDIMWLNNDAWFGIFENSTDTALMARAIQWCVVAIDRYGRDKKEADDMYDTQANLLYKMGRREDALAAMQKIVDRKVARTGKPAEEAAKETLKTMEKMRAGLATWD